MVATKSEHNEGTDPARSLPFGKKNYIYLGISLIVIIIGFICLGYGDDPNHPITLTVAPILLVIGYAMIPFAILAKDKQNNTPEH